MTQATSADGPTNPTTADAATTIATGPLQTLTLIGIFAGGPVGDTILVRDGDGSVARVSTGFLHPAQGGPLRLMKTGDGWALLEQAGRIHRLVIG